MSRSFKALVALPAAALVVAATFGLSTPAEAGPDHLVCCENENGTYHPVSENGRAIDHCLTTWDIPIDESPGLYCEEGPPDLTPEEECGQRDATTCFDPTSDPTVFYCYLGFDETGTTACLSFVFGG
jgi:hypothetical protein